jgi:formylglycine-generating enzyme required for sulfatase activity
VAVGIPQEGNGTPEALSSKISDVYPWGSGFLAASMQGNYADSAAEAKGTGISYIKGYRDGFATTAPVMSFSANKFELYDMGGNLWEWCAGCYDGKDPTGKDPSMSEPRVVRGGSWVNSDSAILLSSYRYYAHPTSRDANRGFRVVVVSGAGG